jgi:isopenicillin N synthase-like dioxygenase
LQVWSGDKWLAAPPIDGTYVVNIGDLLGVWTNDRFKPTVHRVLNTSGAERYSIPFFFNPDYDTKVECLDICKPMDGSPPMYASTTCGQHLTKRFDSTFKYRAGKRDHDEAA